MRLTILFLFCIKFLLAQNVYFRINIIGYLPGDSKVALILSKSEIKNKIDLVDKDSGNILLSAKPQKTEGKKWGQFQHQYLFDFSSIKKTGEYFLKNGESKSVIFKINPNVFGNYQEDLLAFMRQQRCGYNPYFEVVCHPGDGRLFFAPVPDSTYFDFSGGWHDAGDQLKYLITSSNATARMLIAYEMAPDKFEDRVDDFGRPIPNNIPDILDEAKWGLDWLLKIHPKPDWLIHQIADDRDHNGFKFPDKDNADYGWGPNSYRPAYFATGKPQGLNKYKSKATGIANLAGRSAAALAIGARIWKKLELDDLFAEKCKKAAISLYQLGKKKEGFQQGNSYKAPYRYNEDTWEDDMEWGATELFKLTNEETYLEEAIKYAYMIKDEGWMARDTIDHYQKYPFMNMGHFELYGVAPDPVKQQIKRWYQANIEKVIARSKTNAFQYGVPFIWCSNNLLVNFITQVNLYEKMTGDYQYHAQMLLHRDWLFGRNPWGTSMFTGIPENGETPFDVHLPGRYLIQDTPAGGLIDGPIYKTIYNNLIGIKLTEPDEFAEFQNEFVVYHDDIGDYSTNEPTMDGTADAILALVLLGQ